MQTRSRDIFATIRTEGALLPADLLQRIAEGDGDLEGLKPNDYHLVGGQKVREAISSSWNKLLGVWNSFRSAVDKLPEKELGTTLTREKWLLPLFQELGYGRLPTSKAVVIEGKSYPISHFWQPAPIHLIGCRVDIDRRTAGVAGAARISPHGLVQEFLNRSEPHLWAFVSNGLRLRILRDNVSLTRQAFVEFDLAGMMDGEVYSDFILLWLLCHQSRVEVPEDKSPEHCWLEKWSQAAQQRGTRALDQLRKGVEEAIKSLGSGFLSHLANTELKQKLKTGTLDKQDYYRQLLRTVYRLIFIFASEDRGLLLDPQADQQAKDCYMQYYSATRLRKLAQKKRGTRHYDLWRGLSLVFDKLGSNEGCPELALPALGSFLWSREAIAELDGCDIANRDLLEAVRALAFTVDNNILRAVDYKNLGSEELGSVYESLLELHPELNVDVGAFELSQAAGSERKTTGSYYTPTSLVNCLLDSALEPVLDKAVKKDDPEQAILNLKICDPASGSGHFLVAAAHRIAKRLAAIRTGDDEPSPEAIRTSLRDVISHCIYGVDINPMSVELCKISLWLEAIEPGKPLSFLDHHIKCGNSLLGTTPALMEQGIPDDAFKPIEGDIKAICNEYKKQNKDEREGQKVMLFDDGKEFPWGKLGSLSTAYNQIEEFDDNTIANQHEKEKQYEEFVKSSSYEFGHLLADAWCAAFVIEKSKRLSYVVTENIFREIEKNPHNLAPWLKEEIKHLAEQYQFFHWYLEFPSVFKVPDENEQPENKQTGLNGGFNCVLGNPPWEKVQPEEQQFFAGIDTHISEATGNKRKKLIKELEVKSPPLFASWCKYKRSIEGIVALTKNSDSFPLSGVGRLNTYSLFLEKSWRLIDFYQGHIGMIVQTGLISDDSNKKLFTELTKSKSLCSLFDFENKEGIFPEVHREQRFCLVTIDNRRETPNIRFGFWLTKIEHLKETDRIFCLSAEELFHISPNTGTCPTFRSRQEASILTAFYNRTGVLVNEKISNPGWDIKPFQFINMTSDSADFESNINDKPEEIYVPVYEGKLTYAYDHRYSTFSESVTNNNLRPVTQEEHQISDYRVRPQYWMNDKLYKRHDSGLKWPYDWFLTFHDIANPNNERTSLFTIVPRVPVGNSIPLILGEINAQEACCLLAGCNSYVFDFACRRRIVSRHLNFFVLKQLPMPAKIVFSKKALWADDSYEDWIVKCAIELSYTCWDIGSFSKDCGYNGPPFVWDDERRFKIRAELDAAYFHLYLGTEQEWKETGSKELLEYFSTPRAAVEYIMETFPIVKRKDGAKYGSYRTKELILEIYNKMAETIKTGTEYKTILEPPPGPPCDAEGNFIPMSKWDISNWPSHIHQPKEKRS